MYVFKKVKKSVLKRFDDYLHQSVLLYYTSKHLLLYFKDISTIKIVITIML